MTTIYNGCCNFGFQRIVGASPAYFGIATANNVTTRIIYQYSRLSFDELTPGFGEQPLIAKYFCVTDDYSLYNVGYDSTSFNFTLSRYNFDRTEVWENDATDYHGCDVDADYVYAIRDINGSPGREVAKINKSDGSDVWATTLTHPSFSNDDVTATSVSVDTDGNCVVTGSGSDLSDCVPCVWYLDSSGSISWSKLGSTSSSADELVTAESSCFDSDGNVYIGMGFLWQGLPGSMSDPTPSCPITHPWIRKYDSSGTLSWEKTKVYDYASPFRSSRQRVSAVEIFPVSGGFLLLATEDVINNNLVPARSVIARQYSGASHGTEDWSFTDPNSGATSTNFTSPVRIHNDRMHFAYSNDRYIYGGGLSNNRQLDKDGTQIASDFVSNYFVKRVAVRPGRHPNFF